MYQTVKKAARIIIPEVLLKKSTGSLNRIRYRRALAALSGAGEEPPFLEMKDLTFLFGKYSFESTYFYDADSIHERGKQRAGELQLLLEEIKSEQQQFLELGCGDGMVSGILQQKGKRCTAIDFYDGGFDGRAKKSGVAFYKMDAAEMSFEDNSFDFIFSYNAFEHFPKPGQVLKESLRVLRKGGYLYLEFSPLFMSSFGLHAYKSIPVPYCQHLFRESDMEAFIRERKLEPVNFTTHVNRWTIGAFRKLWLDHEEEMDTIFYEEIKNFADLHLVWKYPSCFRSKTDQMDDLVVGGIRTLFKKK